MQKPRQEQEHKLRRKPSFNVCQQEAMPILDLIQKMEALSVQASCCALESQNPRFGTQLTVPYEDLGLEGRIDRLLKQNTGEDICDSGGYHGRHWQMNQKKDFEKEPVLSMEVWEDQAIPSLSTYHYLKNFLGVTKKSDELDESLHEFMRAPERQDNSYLQDMKEWVEKNSYGNIGVTNTYNGEDTVSQVLQYDLFMGEEPKKGEEGVDIYDCDHIALQIHNGCDVRGGYTRPRVFAIDEPGSFMVANTDINAADGAGNFWRSDNAGYSYYSDEDWDKEPDWRFDKENQKVFNRENGKEVKFFPAY